MLAIPASPRTASSNNRNLINPTDHFVDRHVGPRSKGIQTMLERMGLPSLDALIYEAVPDHILLEKS